MKSQLLPLPRLLGGLLVFVLLVATALAQTTLTPGRVGAPYTHRITTNPAAPAGTIYSATGLPPGLSINGSDGTINGTPTSAGTFHGTVSLLSGGIANNYAVVVAIASPAGTPTISGATTAAGQAGTPGFSYSFAIPGADAALSVNASGLPSGITLATTTAGAFVTGGTLSGTPAAAGSYVVTLSANNATGTGAPLTLAITIAPAVGAPVITSAASATASTTARFDYQITATNSPTSYAASGLPLGLALNVATGAIGGTATVPGIYAVRLTAIGAGGTSSPFNLSLAVGGLPVVSSALAVSGTVGALFTYTITASNTPTSFNVGTPPVGFTVNTSTGLISGTASVTGVTSIPISANNATGTGPSVTLVITIGAALPTGGGGGGTPIPPPVVVAAPTITTQPLSQSVVEGSSVTLSVSATGTGLNFQWFKNGSVISGAQAASYTIASAVTGSAGTYTVYVSNSGGAVTSAGAVLTVTAAPPPATLPTLSTAPVAASGLVGGSASFTVVAAGSAPLTYQWRKDGVALTGATAATLNLTGLTAASAGSYSVVVTNSAGSVTSTGATLTVTAAPIAGTYLGAFAGNGGVFGLLVRADRTGLFLGYASATRMALFSRDVVVDASGRFSVTQRGGPAAVSTTNPPTAAAESDLTITGTIAADGTLSGAVPALGLSYTAPAAPASGATAAVAGFYQAGAAGSSAQSLALVGPAGEAVVVIISGSTADGGRGTVTAAGALSVTTAASATVAGTIAATTGTLTATATSGTAAPVIFAGTTDPRNEKLINLSTRSLTGTATDNLIAGFVISGTEAKPVLVRAIGPTLAAFGVNGALSAVRLEVFQGATSVAVGNDWGAPANNPTTVAAVAARVGAFALPANSRDASLVLSLTPGNYTAVVTGQGGVSGVALVEVYDATVGAIPPAQRVVNIATRATAGTGDNTLIAGFYIAGTVPKRVLIRGVGPGLTQFGVGGVLARPQLSVAAGNTVLAQNAGLASSADAAAIVAAATQVGAFALPANAPDAAILINLAPGGYTAKVSGTGTATGVALVEIYEVP